MTWPADNWKSTLKKTQQTNKNRIIQIQYTYKYIHTHTPNHMFQIYAWFVSIKRSWNIPFSMHRHHLLFRNPNHVLTSRTCAVHAYITDKLCVCLMLRFIGGNLHTSPIVDYHRSWCAVVCSVVFDVENSTIEIYARHDLQ